MNRLFITGDTHGTLDVSKLNSRQFPIHSGLDKSDILIVAGDWGEIWDGSNTDKYWQDWFNDKPWTTFVTLGNHENYDLVEKFPIVDFMGGKARQIRDSVFAEIRGEIYNFGNFKVLSFGGADSTDKEYRKEGESWWRQETISDEDVERALTNLKKVDGDVDIIVTHTGGSEVTRFLGFEATPSDEKVMRVLAATEFYANDKVKHYCGHYHVDMSFYNHCILYDDIIEVVKWED